MDPSLWRFLEAAIDDIDLAGYTVEAVDGPLGIVDAAGRDGDARFLAVDTGIWIFGRSVIVPAGLVEEVDTGRRLVRVNCSREQVRGSPEPDPERGPDAAYRRRLDDYYSGQVPPSAAVSDP